LRLAELRIQTFPSLLQPGDRAADDGMEKWRNRHAPEWARHYFAGKRETIEMPQNRELNFQNKRPAKNIFEIITKPTPDRDECHELLFHMAIIDRAPGRYISRQATSCGRVSLKHSMLQR
jgi:hypothetical protein